MRRTERGLGVAIREGQQSGEVLTLGQRRDLKEAAGHSSISAKDLEDDSYELADIYAMTDGVSDEQFEEAIAEGATRAPRARVTMVWDSYTPAGPMPFG